MLRAVTIFLLDGDAFDIVRVHDLLDPPIVVEDRQSGHLIKIGQMLLVSVAALDESIACSHQGVSFHASVLQSPGHALSMCLFGPLWPLVNVESSRTEELAVKDFRLVVDVVLDCPLASCIVTGLVHREGVILDVIFACCPVGWHECLFVFLADGLAKLVPNDVPVPDLLVDRWVVDQGALSLRH